jgi:valyl-tRNA synthetase
MDESYVEAIYEEFLRWWERGLIYRGARVVNWCPRCRSAISDIEVETEERNGKLYHFRYPFIKSSSSSSSSSSSKRRPTEDDHGFITIATTRPETLLGDTAVAVNPLDDRYRAWIRRMIELPLTDRQIPLIADEYAKMEFGTGAVKVTPAHDLDDFECGLRHNLPQVVVIGEDGRMTDAAGPKYAGMDRFDAREAVVRDMVELGLLDKIEDHRVVTPICERCKTVIEPLLSEQWFVRQEELAKPAIEVVKDGKVKFIPDRYTRIYLDWMEKIRPWCISRQLWWGHRIPVWWCDDGRYTAARSTEDAAKKLGVAAKCLRQDDDVLDTWFSSALWPHATLGWPNMDSEDLRFWYPTDLMATAQEIIYLWVARMIMTGLDFVGDIPFRDVYIHATVLDDKGERMSKTKENGVDPLEMIDKYGADALRFSLLQQAGKNQDFRYSEERVRLAGLFFNKLWNASKFVMMNLADWTTDETHEEKGSRGERERGSDQSPQHPITQSPNHSDLTIPDRWILSRLNRTIAEVNGKLATYDMDDAMRAIYSFLWDDFCDWYLEMAKSRLREGGPEKETVQAVLFHVLETTLRLMHPMMPYITEEIWQALSGRRGEGAKTGRGDAVVTPHHTIMFQIYPQVDESALSTAAEERMELVIDVTRAFRNLRAEMGIPPSKRLKGLIVPGSRKSALPLSDNSGLIAELARLDDVTMADAPPAGKGKWVSSPLAGADVYLEIGDALDIPKELDRIAREIAAVEADLAASLAKLSNKQFVERAKPEIVERERSYSLQLADKRDKLLARQKIFTG